MAPIGSINGPSSVDYGGHLPMNLHHLELFYYVAKHEGISRAVRHIPYGIQQPAVSSQILLLEQDLGAKLFDRQPFRLTSEGKDLYEFARPFFDNADVVGTQIRNRGAPKLRIAAAELILRVYLPAVIEQLKAKHPKLRFGMKSGLQRDMERWLQEGEIDLAITPLEAKPQPGLKCIPLVAFAPVLLVPRTSSIKSVDELWARDSLDEALITLPPDEPLTRTFRKGLREMRVEWPTTLEASSSEVVTQYVASGYGIGLALKLPDLISHPKVRVLPLPGFDPVEVALLWRPPIAPFIQEVCGLIDALARKLWPEAIRS